MSEVVVDASAVGTVLLPDEDGKVAEDIRRLVLDSAIRAPAHWPLEVINLILKAERRGRMNMAEGSAARSGALLLLGAAAVEHAPVATTFDLAVKHRLNAYDAAYLELALRLRLPLLTRDGPLRKAASAEAVALLT